MPLMHCYSIDDTKKAAGHKTMDVKTGHVTLVKRVGDQSFRQTFSTGYLENTSHSGSDSAAGVQSWLTHMYVLTDVFCFLVEAILFGGWN